MPSNPLAGRGLNGLQAVALQEKLLPFLWWVSNGTQTQYWLFVMRYTWRCCSLPHWASGSNSSTVCREHYQSEAKYPAIICIQKRWQSETSNRDSTLGQHWSSKQLSDVNSARRTDSNTGHGRDLVSFYMCFKVGERHLSIDAITLQPC